MQNAPVKTGGGADTALLLPGKASRVAFVLLTEVEASTVP